MKFTEMLIMEFIIKQVKEMAVKDGMAKGLIQEYKGDKIEGVVHAQVDQKLVKSNKITGFNRCPNTWFGH